MKTIRYLILFLASAISALSMSAAAPKVPVQAAPKAIQPASPAGPALNKQVALVEYGEVVFLTDLEGQRFWQLRVENKGKIAAEDMVVPAWLHGFKPRSEVACHSEPVPLIAPGAYAYVRGPLPTFAGAHLLCLGSGDRHCYELPQGYRYDNSGLNALGLKIEQIEVIETGQPDRVSIVVTTNENIFAPISKGAVRLNVFVRGRYRASGMKGLELPVLFGGDWTLEADVPSGGKGTFRGEVHIPADIAITPYFDRVAARLGKQVESKPVSKIHYSGCNDFYEGDNPSYGIEFFESVCLSQ